MKERIMNKNNIISGIVLAAIFCAGIVIGVNKDIGSLCYVSQAEVIKLEKERVGENEESLFFGRAKEAARIISDVSDEFKPAKSILIYSNEPLVGQNLRSISREVHAETIKRMQGK